MTANKMSAKQFREPLLKVLGNLTKHTADTEVNFERTYKPIFKIMGITKPEDFGIETSSGKPWPERWVQAAFTQLVKKGQAARAGRGKWALTHDGVTTASKLNAHDGTVLDEPEEDVEELAVDPNEGDPEVVSIPVGPVQTQDTYHDDPYLRGLAADLTPCFSNYSDKSTTCETCPLQGACINALAANLSGLATTLVKENKQAAAARKAAAERAKQGVAPTTVTPDKTAAPITKDVLDGLFDGKDVISPAVNLDPKQVRRVHAAFPSVCRGCNGSIDKDGDAVWVRNKTAGGKGSAMFHVKCFEKTFGTTAPN